MSIKEAKKIMVVCSYIIKNRPFTLITHPDYFTWPETVEKAQKILDEIRAYPRFQELQYDRLYEASVNQAKMDMAKKRAFNIKNPQRADALEPLFFIAKLLGPHSTSVAFGKANALPCDQDAATNSIYDMYAQYVTLPKTHGTSLCLEDENMWAIKNAAAICTYVIENPPKEINPNSSRKWGAVIAMANEMLDIIAPLANPDIVSQFSDTDVFCFAPKRLGVFAYFRTEDGKGCDPVKATKYLDNVCSPKWGRQRLKEMRIGQLRSIASDCANIIQHRTEDSCWDSIEGTAKGILYQIGKLARSAQQGAPIPGI